jgi:hypothetical protein
VAGRHPAAIARTRDPVRTEELSMEWKAVEHDLADTPSSGSLTIMSDSLLGSLCIVFSGLIIS